MSIDCKIGAVTVTGLGLVLALASLNLFTPQASATLEDRPFECPTGVQNGPPCGPPDGGRDRPFDCPNGTPEGPPCGPPNRDEPRD